MTHEQFDQLPVAVAEWYERELIYRAAGTDAIVTPGDAVREYAKARNATLFGEVL